MAPVDCSRGPPLWPALIPKRPPSSEVTGTLNQLLLRVSSVVSSGWIAALPDYMCEAGRFASAAPSYRARLVNRGHSTGVTRAVVSLDTPGRLPPRPFAEPPRCFRLPEVTVRCGCPGSKKSLVGGVIEPPLPAGHRRVVQTESHSSGGPPHRSVSRPLRSTLSYAQRAYCHIFTLKLHHESHRRLFSNARSRADIESPVFPSLTSRRAHGRSSFATSCACC